MKLYNKPPVRIKTAFGGFLNGLNAPDSRLTLLLSFVVLPAWPLLWLRQARGFPHFVPIAFGLGVLLAVAVLWLRDPDAKLLLLMSAMPQRWFYDALVLWLIPKTNRELQVTCGISWVAFVWWYCTPVVRYGDVWLAMIVCNYLPMLAILAWRHRPDRLRAQTLDRKSTISVTS